MTDSSAPMRIGDVVVSGVVRARIGADLSLRGITVSGRRALDALSFAVRDAAWNTARTDVESFEGSHTSDGFWIRFRCRQHGPGMDVTWTGTITGAGGAIRAELDGVPGMMQDLNRAGFTVLHPIELRGRRVLVSTATGTVDGRFPQRIDPDVLFTRVTGMECDLGGAWLLLRFSGDEFETEDHRNWSDAGWKTYCTPLGVPSPQRYQPGDRIRQSVELAVQGSCPSEAGSDSVVSVTVGDDVRGRFPALGAGASDFVDQATAGVTSVRDLGLAFLQVELVDGDDEVGRLERAAREAALLQVPLHVILVTESARLAAWASLLDRCEAPIKSVSVHHGSTNSSSSALVASMRRALDRCSGAAAGARVGGGTRGYFAELNRLGDRLEPAEFLEFSLSPQVHASEDESLMDTALALPDVIRDAVDLADGRPVRVGPISLRQRFNVHRRPSDAVLPADRPGPDVDPRQHSPFAAVWLLGTAAGLIGAESLSLFRTRGRRGIIPDGADGHWEKDALPPARVVAELAGLAGAPVLNVRISDPRRVMVLAVRQPDASVSLYLANRTPTAIRCAATHRAHQLDMQLGPWEVKRAHLNLPARYSD